MISRELEEKQLTDVITEVFHELVHDDEVLIPPDNDQGIFKYAGTRPEAQFYLSKACRRRDVMRAGLGFVIQRAQLPSHFRISIDVEISPEVTGKDAQKLVELMNLKAQNDYSMRAPVFIVYTQPAHSGHRGWAEKNFVGVELEIQPNDLQAIHKLGKKILFVTRQLFQALDYALVED